MSQKAGLVKSGVLDAALRCLRDSKWPHVHFKCLGIARLLAPLKGKTPLKTLLDPFKDNVQFFFFRGVCTAEPARDGGSGV